MIVETVAKIREYHQMSIPNLITLTRISLIPLFVVVFYLPFNWSYLVSSLIFSVAALTDLLDGYLARKLKQVSRLGEFLDPVADKLMVAAALLLLVQVHGSIWLSVPALIIVCREIVISALREWMAELGQRQKVAVSHIGKIKTAAQMFAIILLLSQNPSQFTLITILGYLLLYAAAILTLWSMVLYLRTALSEYELV